MLKPIRLLAARCSSWVQGLGHGARLVHGADENALREGCLTEQVCNGVVALCIPAATCRCVSRKAAGTGSEAADLDAAT